MRNPCAFGDAKAARPGLSSILWPVGNATSKGCWGAPAVLFESGLETVDPGSRHLDLLDLETAASVAAALDLCGIVHRVSFDFHGRPSLFFLCLLNLVDARLQLLTRYSGAEQCMPALYLVVRKDPDYYAITQHLGREARVVLVEPQSVRVDHIEVHPRLRASVVVPIQVEPLFPLATRRSIPRAIVRPGVLAPVGGENASLAGAAIAGPYAPTNFADPGDAFSAVTGDVIFRCPSLTQAGSAATYVPTYVYEFRYPNAEFALDEVPLLPSLDRSQFVGWSDGAFHSADIQYVFGVPMFPSKSEFESDSVDDQLWRTVRGYWARFARTGDPNGDGVEPWPKFDRDDPEFLVLDVEVKTASDGPTDACAFWEGTDYLVPSF